MNYTQEQLESYTVAQLRTMLDELEQPTTGTKPVLIQRILDYYAQSARQDEAEAGETTTGYNKSIAAEGPLSDAGQLGPDGWATIEADDYEIGFTLGHRDGEDVVAADPAMDGENGAITLDALGDVADAESSWVYAVSVAPKGELTLGELIEKYSIRVVALPLNQGTIQPVQHGLELQALEDGYAFSWNNARFPVVEGDNCVQGATILSSGRAGEYKLGVRVQNRQTGTVIEHVLEATVEAVEPEATWVRYRPKNGADFGAGPFAVSASGLVMRSDNRALAPYRDQFIVEPAADPTVVLPEDEPGEVTVVDGGPVSFKNEDGMLLHGIGYPATKMVVASNTKIELGLCSAPYQASPEDPADGKYALYLQPEQDWNVAFSAGLLEGSTHRITDLYDVRLTFFGNATGAEDGHRLILRLIPKAGDQLGYDWFDGGEVRITDSTTDAEGRVSQNIQRYSFYNGFVYPVLQPYASPRGTFKVRLEARLLADPEADPVVSEITIEALNRDQPGDDDTPELESIAVTGLDAGLEVGGTAQATATGSLNDGSTTNLTDVVTWASTDEEVATVDADGLVTAVGAGTASITATLESVVGSAEVTVTAAAVAPTISTTTLPNGTEGVAYEQTLAASGDSPITWSVSNGALPDGLSLSAAGVISGTPTTAAENVAFQVTATNDAGSDTQDLTLTIEAAGE